jgi:hypothetical protein
MACYGFEQDFVCFIFFKRRPNEDRNTSMIFKLHVSVGSVVIKISNVTNTGNSEFMRKMQWFITYDACIQQKAIYIRLYLYLKRPVTRATSWHSLQSEK